MSVMSRELRGRLLLALNAAKGLRLGLDKLYAIVRDDHLPATVRGVKDEMAYLESKNYATRFGSDQWQITAAGTDVVEGNIDPDPGIILPDDPEKSGRGDD